MEFLISAIRHYADFKGRCTRKPFWMFVVTTHVCLMLVITPLLMAATEVYTRLLIEQPSFSTWVESIILQDDVTEEQAAELIDMFNAIAQEGAEILLSEHMFAVACAAVGVLLGVFLFIPSLSITVRRVRDAGQSPWWVYLSLIGFIPYPLTLNMGTLLALVVFILCCLPSAPVKAELMTDRTLA